MISIYLVSKMVKFLKERFLFFNLLALIFCDIYSVTSKSDFKFITNKYRFNKSKLIYRPN